VQQETFLCNTQQLIIWLQEKKAALTTACSETSVNTATDMERHISNGGDFSVNKFNAIPSLPHRIKRRRPYDTLVFV